MSDSWKRKLAQTSPRCKPKSSAGKPSARFGAATARPAGSWRSGLGIGLPSRRPARGLDSTRPGSPLRVQGHLGLTGQGRLRAGSSRRWRLDATPLPPRCCVYTPFRGRSPEPESPSGERAGPGGRDPRSWQAGTPGREIPSSGRGIESKGQTYAEARVVVQFDRRRPAAMQPGLEPAARHGCAGRHRCRPTFPV